MGSRQRICLGCGELKPSLCAFTPIRGTNKVYGRCKACRARQAREKSTATRPDRAASARGEPRHPPSVARVRAVRSQPLRRRAQTPNPRIVTNERTCTECGVTKPLSGFLRIKATRHGYYGRCRLRRNARARARYHSNEPARLAEIERTKRNARRRKEAAQRVAA